MQTAIEVPITTPRSITRPLLTSRGKRDVKYVDISDTFDRSWDPIFKNSEYTIEQLLEILYRNGYSVGMKVYPYPTEVLSAFSIPVTSVKIVVIGQDPYPGWDAAANRPIACGKTFATLSKTCPASLGRVISAIQNEFKTISFADKEHPYSLKGWVDQGVLLLNRTPVYYDSKDAFAKPDRSAKDIWEGMTELICRYVIEINPQCAFLLVGRDAHELEPKLGSCVKTNHPSTRSELDFDGKCFRQIRCINWTAL